MPEPTLSVVIVAHDSLGDLRDALPPLLDELADDDEVIIVDSGSRDGLEAGLPGLAPRARLVNAGANVGFAAGANRGAARAGGDLLVLLNPDAVVQPGWAAAIRAPWGGPWAAWMGLVLLKGGQEINTSGGVLHFTGLAWAGQIGAPVAEAPSALTEVGFLSGACLAIPRRTWEGLGGFSERFFMYCEDVDLSLRLRLHGGRLAVAPDARVHHDYEFAKGASKWRLLERNRWATVIRTYPGPLFLAVVPALLACELAIWVTAFRGRWATMKAHATLDLVRMLPRLRQERRTIQACAGMSAAEFAGTLTADLSSPYLGTAGHHPLIRGALTLYWDLVVAGLRRGAPGG